MSQIAELVKLSPPRSTTLPPLHLQPGRHYRSRGNATWCCFQCVGDDYHCIRLPDNIINVYQRNGLERYAKDDSSEHTLVAATFERSRRLENEMSLRLHILSHLDQSIESLGKFAADVESVIGRNTEAKYRLKHLQKVLGELANDGDARAKDALLWLADREQNQFRLEVDDTCEWPTRK